MHRLRCYRRCQLMKDVVIADYQTCISHTIAFDCINIVLSFNRESRLYRGLVSSPPIGRWRQSLAHTDYTVSNADAQMCRRICPTDPCCQRLTKCQQLSNKRIVCGDAATGFFDASSASRELLCVAYDQCVSLSTRIRLGTREKSMSIRTLNHFTQQRDSNGRPLLSNQVSHFLFRLLCVRICLG